MTTTEKAMEDAAIKAAITAACERLRGESSAVDISAPMCLLAHYAITAYTQSLPSPAEQEGGAHTETQCLRGGPRSGGMCERPAVCGRECYAERYCRWYSRNEECALGGRCRACGRPPLSGDSNAEAQAGQQPEKAVAPAKERVAAVDRASAQTTEAETQVAASDASVAGQWMPYDFPDPTQAMLEDPLFNAIWRRIKQWDIGVPEWSGGLHTGAMGNHARAILDAVQLSLASAPPAPSDSTAVRAVRALAPLVEQRLEYFRCNLQYIVPANERAEAESDIAACVSALSIAREVMEGKADANGGWRELATTPLDEKPEICAVALFCGPNWSQANAGYINSTGQVMIGGHMSRTATHWMPMPKSLPTPPSTQGEG